MATEGTFNDILLDTSLSLTLDGITPEQVRKAQGVVIGYAKSTEDAREILTQLGLFVRVSE